MIVTTALSAHAYAGKFGSKYNQKRELSRSRDPVLPLFLMKRGLDERIHEEEAVCPPLMDATSQGYG